MRDPDFWIPPLYILTALPRKLWAGSPQIRTTGIFLQSKAISTLTFFIGNCQFFHSFSTKYILDFQKKLSVGFSRGRYPKLRLHVGHFTRAGSTTLLSDVVWDCET